MHAKRKWLPNGLRQARGVAREAVKTAVIGEAGDSDGVAIVSKESARSQLLPRLRLPAHSNPTQGK